MTMFRVVIKGEGLDDARTTEAFDDAMDWITNAIEQVVDEENPISAASLEVDGVEWVSAVEGGLSPPPGGELLPMRKVA